MFDEAFSINHFDKMKITHISFDNFAAQLSDSERKKYKLSFIYLHRK